VGFASRKPADALLVSMTTDMANKDHYYRNENYYHYHYYSQQYSNNNNNKDGNDDDDDDDDDNLRYDYDGHSEMNVLARHTALKR